jgi:hypothetical protein
VIYHGISSNCKSCSICKLVLLFIETVILTKKSKNHLKNLSICSKNLCFCSNMPIDEISRIVWYANCYNFYSVDQFSNPSVVQIVCEQITQNYSNEKEINDEKVNDEANHTDDITICCIDVSTNDVGDGTIDSCQNRGGGGL